MEVAITINNIFILLYRLTINNQMAQVGGRMANMGNAFLAHTSGRKAHLNSVAELMNSCTAIDY